jgi:hypothetical protein
LVSPSVCPLVGPFVPISLQKLVMLQLLRAWGLVTTLFINIFDFSINIFQNLVRRGVRGGKGT